MVQLIWNATVNWERATRTREVGYIILLFLETRGYWSCMQYLAISIEPWIVRWLLRIIWMTTSSIRQRSEILNCLRSAANSASIVNHASSHEICHDCTSLNDRWISHVAGGTFCTVLLLMIWHGQLYYFEVITVLVVFLHFAPTF